MTPRAESFTIEHSLPRERFDSFLRTRFPAVSRGTFQRLIVQGHIRVNGDVIKPTHAPRAGEEVSIAWPDPTPAAAQPEEIPLDVLFEDEDLVVLNKPPGLVVHPAAGNTSGTLVNALLRHCRGQLSGIGGVARPGIVHRLDKDTSGCLVVAKNDPTHLKLAEQFARREVTKIYNAIVCGEVTPDRGDIRAPIARDPARRKRMKVIKGGRGARTSYRILEQLRGATLVEVQLHTGRTHQIRVHFEHLGFPLLGDATYGKKQNKQWSEHFKYEVPRQMLHARALSFVHPSSGRKETFEAPWPEDFASTVVELRSGAQK
jgi:23S rRNA pseudouridine1911/1915/1917 synthase